MEPEGMTMFWARKVRTKRPTTSTEQIPARDSKIVSFGWSASDPAPPTPLAFRFIESGAAYASTACR